MNTTGTKKDFFILTAPRSGSTVLTRTLDQHPQIFCAGELFHPSDKIYHPEWHFPFIGTKKKKGISRKIFAVTNSIKGYFSGVSHIKKFYRTRDKKEIRGFKLMIGHIKDFPTVFKYLRQNDLKILVLIRKNTFREALSSFRARKIGVFHATEEHTLSEKKVNVNADRLKKRVDELEAINDAILRLSEAANRLVITYEEFENWQQMLNKVFNFLDVQQIEMQPELRKTSAANWREGVENYEDVERVMKEKYAHYIN
jgi:LPS sulfotransferase NodH